MDLSQVCSYPFFHSPEAAWGALDRYVDQALSDIGAKFYCGLLAGPAPEQLYRAMNTELVLVEDRGPYRPRLVPTSPTTFLLRVPEHKLAAHAGVMKTAYLLRAQAEHFLRSTTLERAELDQKCWRFLETKMFGHMPTLMRQLADVGSLEQLHKDGVPRSLLLGHMANHRPGFSMCSKYNVVPYNGLPDVNHAYVPPLTVPRNSRRLLGERAHHAYVPKLVNALRASGRLDTRDVRRAAHLSDDFQGMECFVIRSLSCELFSEKDLEPLGALVRTVVCTNDLRSGRLFQPLLSSTVFH
jgi:hypothetical protein